MKTLSLKLDERILSDTEAILKELDGSRNGYFNDAIDYYNRLKKRQLIAEQLAYESKLTAEDSMSVLAEFEAFEDDH